MQAAINEHSALLLLACASCCFTSAMSFSSSRVTCSRNRKHQLYANQSFFVISAM
jgi:hypothetical protein